MKFKTKDLTLYSVLISVSLFLSFLESQLPPFIAPIPGIKLGLANTVILFSLYSYGALPSFCILFCRCVLASFFGGGITSFFFSLTGGIFAILIMVTAKKSGIVSIYGVSIAGAAFHSIGQILVAGVMFLSFSIILYLPFMLFSSIVTGTIIAFITKFLIGKFNKNV